MIELIKNPAVLVGLIRAVLILLIAFGVSVTTPQQDSILELVGAMTAVASLLLSGVTTALTTPKDAPTLESGTVVKVVTPAGQPDFTTTL